MSAFGVEDDLMHTRLGGGANVGVSVAGDLRQLGITSPGDLPGRDPYADAQRDDGALSAAGLISAYEGGPPTCVWPSRA